MSRRGGRVEVEGPLARPWIVTAGDAEVSMLKGVKLSNMLYDVAMSCWMDNWTTG